MSPDDLLQLATLLEGQSFDARTLVRNPSSTVEPPRDAERGRRALEALKKLQFDPAALEDIGPLGEGGMGLVRLARQVSLDRTVAVKFLKPGRRGAAEIEALLAEAWLAGGLEHPNIMPVHALSLDADGTPSLVMMRIEGETWAVLLRDPARLAEISGGKPTLDEHLRILQQVCNAAHFAHARGVVHRDLKPENVMVGLFGEVYVVDWGIAVAPGPSRQLAGTPAYMAPEMIGAPGMEITPRTDVYLLGAMLFEVLTGRAPHRGAHPTALFESVLRSEPELPTDAPEELAALVRRCMNKDAALRPASALEVRLALESFVQHQGSLVLAQQSEQRALEMQFELSKPEPDAARLSTLFSECRFGFQQALAAWPGNTRARAGLDSVLRAMIRFELANGSPRTARALIADLPSPDATLTAEIDRALEREAEKNAQITRLQELERTLNPSTGGVARMAMAFVIGAVWVGALYLSLLRPGDRAFEQLGAGCIALIITAVLLVIGRRLRALDTPLNRQLVATLAFAMGAQGGTLITLHLAHVNLGTLLVPVLMGYWFIISGVVASSVLPAVWLSSAGYLLAAIGAAVWPEYAHGFSVFGNVVFCANSAFIFRQQKQIARTAPG